MKYIKLFEEFRIDLYESLMSARELYLKTELISDEDFNMIKELDPSKNFKYIEKMVEFYIKGYASILHIGQVFKDFDNLGKRNQIKNPDISRFKSLREIEETVQSAQSKYVIKKEFKEKSGDIDIVFEDKNLLVLTPKTHEAVCKYGSGTKWCITEQNPHWFLSYRLEKASHYFILMKGMEQANPFYKIAVSVYPDNDIECFDSLDNRITFEEVLEKTGLDKDLFVFNPLPLTADEEILFSIRKEIRENDFESNQSLIKDLLKDLKDVNIQDPKSGSGLLVIFLKNHLFDCAKMLIEMGVDINQKTSKGAYPIEFAYFVKGGEELVKMMKERGAEEPKSLKDLEIFAKIVEEGKKESAANIQVIEQLLDSMENINIQEPKFGDTLLISILFYERVDISKLIIEKGADPNITNRELTTPLMVAAIKKEGKEVITLLLKKGLDIDAKDLDGETALLKACAFGILDNVKILYDNNADIEIIDNEGYTAISYALYNDKFDVIKFLIEKGATEINTIYDDETILTEAVKEGEMEIVKALLKRSDLEPNIQVEDDMTALHFAVNKSDKELVGLLLSHPKIDITLTNNESKTPWDLATPEIREVFPKLNPNE